MTKAELSALIAERTACYCKPVYTHAESVDQQRRLHKRLETRKKPVNLAQETWERYVQALKDGTYRPEHHPEAALYDYEGL